MSTYSNGLISSLVTVSFTALSGAGSISVPGLMPGDVIMTGLINDVNVWGGFSSLFEPVVSVANELQQLSGNLVGPTFTLYLIRPVL
jgi:hypothetical protein